MSSRRSLSDINKSETVIVCVCVCVSPVTNEQRVQFTYCSLFFFFYLWFGSWGLPHLSPVARVPRHEMFHLGPEFRKFNPFINGLFAHVQTKDLRRWAWRDHTKFRRRFSIYIWSVDIMIIIWHSFWKVIPENDPAILRSSEMQIRWLKWICISEDGLNI